MWNEALEELIVVKRSGQRVEFNASKIAIAIKKAFDAVYDEADEKQIYKVFEKVLNYINNNYNDRKTINVEDIQDIIEHTLKEEKIEEVYLSFNDYRNKRAASRKVFNEKQQHKFVKAIEKVQEEGSKGSTYATPLEVLNKFGKIISSEYTKSYILDTKYVRALEEGNIYVHNLDFFSLGFISHLNLKLNVKDLDNLDEMLSEIINTQDEISNEIGINSFDKLIEKYILKKYRELLKKYLKKYFNLYGILELINFKKYEELINKITDISEAEDSLKTMMINNNIKYVIKTALKDTDEDISEMVVKIINRLFGILANNLKRNKTFTISISNNASYIGNLVRDEIINYLNSTNRMDNIHIVFKISSEDDDEYLNKIINLIINSKNISLSFPKNSYNYEVNNEVEYFSNGYRVFENINDNVRSSNGRMLIATSSINLARLGLKNRNKKREVFYEELDQIVELIKNELLLMFETIGNKNKDNYKTLFNGNVNFDEKLEGNQKIRKVLKNGSLNIGLIGLKECVMLLEEDENKQYDLVLEILNYLNNKCRLFSEEYKINFNLCEPSDKFARKSLIAIDKSIYGFNKGITNKESYDLIDSLKVVANDFEKIATIQELFKGGKLVKIEIPRRRNNKSILELIRFLIDADIGYVYLEVVSK